MKIKLIITLVLTLMLSSLSFAQEEKQEKPKIETVEFRVFGICNECKERIENALDLPGVKFAEWDKESEIVTVIYKTSKIEEDDLHKALVETGHETSKMKPSTEKYQSLPACCQYHDHEKH